MTTKTQNKTIGKILCPFSGKEADLRRCRTGQRLFYYMSEAGKVTPNLRCGQRYIYDHARFDDPEDRRQLADYLGIDPTLNPEIPKPVQSAKPEEESRDFDDDDDLIVTRVGSGKAPEPVRNPEPESRVSKPARAANDEDDFFTALGF